MADPPSSESLTLANDESTRQDEARSSLQFGEDVYHEPRITESMSSKTDVEEGALLDYQRLVTAGTAHSNEQDYDQFSDDEVVLARCSAVNEHEVMQPTNSAESEGHGLLVRPEIPQPLEGNDHFHFSPANQQSVLSTPSRSVPPSNAMPTPCPTDDENEIHNEYAQPAPQPDRGERKRKKTKKRKAQQQTFQEGTVKVPEDTMVGSEVVPDPHVDGSPTLPHPQAMDLDQEQNTLYHETIHNVQQYDDGSPHSQLQNEFEGAAEPQQQLDEDPSVATRQMFQQTEDQHEVREPSPVDDVNVQPPQIQHESTNSAIVDDSDHPPHSTVQSRKSKSSRRTAPAPQGQSVAARVWTVFDYAELLKFKIQEDEQARMAVFNAELETLQAQIRSATEAKTAIQSELDSVLEQKQQLTGTIEEQIAKIAKYETRFKGFKTFVDGLGKDLDVLRKDANSQRRRMDDIAQEVESSNNRKLAAYLELDERAKDCSNFKDKALKLASDKDEELQKVLGRQAELERDRDNAIQDFDNLRARCADLERQLNTITNPSDKLVRVLKSNHDALLDKLHFIHLSVEEGQKISCITELIERLESASKTMSSSISSGNEDVSSIKTLVEALDRR